MPDDPRSLLALLQQHLSWYPLMEPRDVYKLLYQGVMGSEHLLTSPDDFTKHLSLEFEKQQADSHERLLVPVRPDQTLLRINLRAYKSRQRRIDFLVPSLLKTARSISGNLTELQGAWMEFIRYCTQGMLPMFNLNEVHHFNLWLERMQFPAVQHSEVYRREYQPAYRLIMAKYISELGLIDAS